MSDGFQSRISRIVADLQKPAGGWTTGILTLLAAIAPAPMDAFGYWPGPTWSTTLVMAAFLAIHMVWGAAGYYPRRM